MSKLDEAISFAAVAHADQVRDGSGLPYVTHPLNVMGLVSCVDHTPDMLIAAVLHDVVEDTEASLERVKQRFGNVVALLVDELSTPKTAGNRAERNATELQRLAAISSDAQTIKLADIIDNVRTIRTSKPDFADKYVAEKLAQYDVLVKGDPKMRMRAAEALVNAMT